MCADASVKQAVRDFVAAGKWVASICAGPTVLRDAGVLTGGASPVTACREDLQSAGTWVDERVVRDGNIVTSQARDCLLLLRWRWWSCWSRGPPPKTWPPGCFIRSDSHARYSGSRLLCPLLGQVARGSQGRAGGVGADHLLVQSEYPSID